MDAKLLKPLLLYCLNFKFTISVFLITLSIASFDEGEHKIMNFIRNGKGNPYIYPSIYGLDADLIILALNLKQSKIRLLREPQNTSIEIAQYHDSKLLYFDIDKTMEALLNYYSLDSYDSTRVIDDFVFTSSLGGNDFCENLKH